jgi:peptidyl-prolyl cis-trans isomerase D
MLQSFRTVINSFVGKVLFGLLLATFALLGVGYGIRDLVLGGGNANEAASVGDAKITLTELEQQFRRQLLAYQRQAGGDFNPTPQQKQELARETLDQQVADALYAQAAAQDGILVGDALIRQVVEAEPRFAGPNKRFDAAHFQALLENNGLTETAFVASERRSLARQLLINPIAGGAVAPKALAEDIYRYRNEQRVAQIVTIPNASVAGVPAPTDAEIQEYYDKHPVEFTAPEYRSFTVLALTPALFAGEVKPTDDDLHAAYDRRKAEYVDPERRKIEQVVVSDKAVADSIAKAAQSGKSLADAAKSATAGKAQPVTIDLLPRDQYPQELQEPVFAAGKGGIVGPVETPLGWHVIMVADIAPGHEVTFDEARPKLEEEVRRDQAADILSDQIDKLGDKLQGGAPMDQVAAGVGATPIKIGPIDARGDAPPGSPKPARPPTPGWLAEAFQLRAGETGQMQEDKEGGYFAVRLDDVTPPALRPLADVRADVVAAWTAEQRAARTAKQADDMAAQVNAGAALDQIAAKAGLKITTTPAVTREPAEKIGNAPPQPVIDAMFQATKIGAVSTVDTGDAQVIVRLSEIRPADPFTAGAKLDAIMREVEGGMQSDTLAQYRAALEQKTKVRINPQAVETVAGQ